MERIIRIIFSFFSLIISGLLSFIGLQEFVKIKLFKQGGEYPFNSEAPSSWIYKSEHFYTFYNLIEGIVFLFLFFFCIKALTAKNIKNVVIGFIATVSFFVLGLCLVSIM
jgi:hypothetical protein